MVVGPPIQTCRMQDDHAGMPATINRSRDRCGKAHIATGEADVVPSDHRCGVTWRHVAPVTADSRDQKQKSEAKQPAPLHRRSHWQYRVKATPHTTGVDRLSKEL
jgi:hypothetical protein